MTAMSTLEHTVYRLRKGWHLSYVFIFTGAFAAIFAGGSFTRFWTDTTAKAAVVLMFGLWAIVFGVKAHRRFGQYKTAKPISHEREDLELGLLLVVATYGAVQLAGGLDSLFYPVVLILVAFLVVYTPQWVGFTLVASAIVIELSIALISPLSHGFHEVVVHAVFIIFFALINLVFTRTEIARMRRYSERVAEQTKAALANDAQEFRLIAPTDTRGWSMTREEETARLTSSSMRQVQDAMYHHVHLLKRTMRLNTCAVLWLDASGENLRVHECVSDTENVITKPFYKGEGVIGAVLKNQKSLRMSSLKPGYAGLTYYASPCAVTDFAGVPIVDSGALRGVLCADRRGRPFDDAELETLEAAVESLLSIIANERVFNQLQKAKSEQGKLLLASEALSKNLGEEEVMQAALQAAAQIVSYDIGAVAMLGPKGQVVCHVVGQRIEGLVGTRVSDKSTLAAQALKTLHYLPYRGEFTPTQQVLFSKKTQRYFSRMRSCMVLPLTAGEKPLGTLTLAAASPRRFDEEVRTTLQVMTNQLGPVLENAKMYQRLKEMATTDGLTGLPNHRVFQEELDKKLASATRFNNELSIIFCDVDKFKRVNDTYGHPVGDMVLRGLAAILRRNVVRDTDLPARYGGEEFAVVCEGTDTDGAFKLAERIRKDLEREVFQAEQGALRVTISMGISTYPQHGSDKETLLERADIALYAAKEGGRNQVLTWNSKMGSSSAA